MGMSVAGPAGVVISRSLTGTSLTDLWLALPATLLLALAGAVAAAAPTPLPHERRMAKCHRPNGSHQGIL